MIIGIIGIIIISSLTSLIDGQEINNPDEVLVEEDYDVHDYEENYFLKLCPQYPEEYLMKCFNSIEMFEFLDSVDADQPYWIGLEPDNKLDLHIFTPLEEVVWSMQGYNRKHIGRSPYCTTINPGVEKWRFAADHWCDGSVIIDKDGTIYFGSGDFYFYAINPEGTLKWKFDAASKVGNFGNSPAISEDGTIYIPTYGGYVQAVYPNGTEKWRHWASYLDTSITIGADGIIYYGYKVGIDALYPNGTKKWTFHTGDVVQSTPAVDDDGIIYFGSHDKYIYAVYPNGTLKWKFKTDNWVHGSPTIGTNGTIYCGSDDDYLYALYQNGTLKWKEKIQGGMRSSPSQDKNGNLYFGTSSGVVTSIATNGSIRWEFDIGNDSGVWGSTAAISDDGTIYIGSNIDYGMLGGGEIIALDLDGNLEWRKIISDSKIRSSPVIGDNGFVYICSSWSGLQNIWGYLHAFGPQETNEPPDMPTIIGPDEGSIKEYYEFKIFTDDPDNNPIAYYVDWGDGLKIWTMEYDPGRVIKRIHGWNKQGNYTIKVKARDTFGAESDWAYFEVTMPAIKQDEFSCVDYFFQQHLSTFTILRQIVGSNQ